MAFFLVGLELPWLSRLISRRNLRTEVSFAKKKKHQNYFLKKLRNKNNSLYTISDFPKLYLNLIFQRVQPSLKGVKKNQGQFSIRDLFLVHQQRKEEKNLIFFLFSLIMNYNNNDMKDGYLYVENYVHGEFEESEMYLDSYNPATGEVWARIPDSNEETVNRAVWAAKNAFQNWADLGYLKVSFFFLS